MSLASYHGAEPDQPPIAAMKKSRHAPRQREEPRHQPDATASGGRGLVVDGRAALPAVWLTSLVRQPLVYSKRIDRADPAARAGDLVAVYAPPKQDDTETPVVRRREDCALLGYGIYNPRATVALRMIRFGTDLPDGEFWDRLIDSAVSLRTGTLGLDGQTSAWRVVHAESDGFSGLVVDRYGDVLSAEAFSLGMHQRARAVLDRLAERLGTRHQVLRTGPATLAQEGFEAPLWRSPGCPDAVDVTEFGTRFRVRLDEETHKTGFFCDQRENRQRLASYCAGRTVLDLCCYSGGFAVQAARLGRAAEVTGVDLDEHPLAAARINANLNQVRIRWVQADVFPWMRDAIRGGRQFDVVVLDPPKLIRNRQELEEGTRKHLDLNRLAMQLVRPGGVLLSCTCAGLLSPVEFMRIIQTAARQAGPPRSEATESSLLSGRRVRIMGVSGASGDHPVAADCPETAYLQAVWMRVDDHA